MYTDVKPLPEQPFESRELARRFEPPDVLISRRVTAYGIEVIAQNTYYGPVQLGYRLRPVDNVALGTPTSGLATLEARSDTTLLTVGKQKADVPIEFAYEVRILPGRPDAMHAPDEPYRLPYALGRSFRVSQAFPASVTHRDLASQHAIDFEMPVGTNVFAARGGVVIEVVHEHFESGTDAADAARANIVRVLHDDGTMALYAHLNWNSIRVVPGQRVARGEYLADSGNTGFTTGPHLHFAVQRNRNGTLVSERVEFAGPAGRTVTPTSGRSYVAY
jgi:murein DD-endopeptidase MepM/ murein hydrolase activator NlpD